MLFFNVNLFIDLVLMPQTYKVAKIELCGTLPGNFLHAEVPYPVCC